MANEYKVTFFNVLQNDNDEVLVRFPYTSKAELETVPAHSLKVGNAWKKIACNRKSPYDALDLCPLCAQQNKLINRFFIKLVYYVQQPDGSYKGQCAVWDRPEYIFKDKIASYLDEYGADLPNTIFKIKRHGAHGDTKTTYDILVPRQDIYPANVFVPDFTNFEGYKMEGINYHVLNAGEMNNLITTGQLPVREKPAQQGQTYGGPTPAYVEQPQAPVFTAPQMQTYTPPAFTQQPATTTYPAAAEYTAPQTVAASGAGVAQPAVIRTYETAPASDKLPQSFVGQTVATPTGPVNPLYGQQYQAPATAVPQPNPTRRYNYE